MLKIKKRYYQHSIWCDSDEWIISDVDSFNDEVIEYRDQFDLKRKFRSDCNIYYFNNKSNSAYDWKVVISLE